MLSKYYVPGLAIEDHSIDVPLDWSGHEPGQAFDGETIKLFYRVVTAPEHVHDDLPLLIFLAMAAAFLALGYVLVWIDHLLARRQKR